MKKLVYISIYLFSFIAFVSLIFSIKNLLVKQNKPIVLLIEDLSNYKDKDFQVIKEVYKDLIKKLQYKFPNLSFYHISLYGDNSLSKDRKNLKVFIEKNKNKIVLIVANNSSSSHSLYENLIPSDIPVITTIGSISLIRSSRFPLFSIYDTSYSRALDIFRSIYKQNYKKVCFLFENPDTYTLETWKHLKKMLIKNQIPIAEIKWNKENLYLIKQILAEEKNEVIFIIGENSTQKQVNLLEELDRNFKSYSFDIFFIRSLSQPLKSYSYKIPFPFQ